MKTGVTILSERPQGNWENFPLQVRCQDKTFYFSLANPSSSEWLPTITDVGKKRQSCEFRFFSSQEGFVFERLHEMLNAYIPDLSVKVDPLLREFIKNAEKQNALHLAAEVGLIPDSESPLSMDIMGRILQEKVVLPDGTPLLYTDENLQVVITMRCENNELHIHVRNRGILEKSKQDIIAKKIELGKRLARFDLRQEFEMKTYPLCKEEIEHLLSYEYTPSEREKLWPFAFEEDFDEYWMISPYFLLIGSGTHTSFFPYYATVHGQLRIVQKQLYHIEEGKYSAGMGYIQSAFIIESNRSLYGTAGDIFTPYQQDDEVVSGFVIGFPSLDIVFSV
ncbi:MAG: hypothetical protein N2314_04885 [Brevinematales bacterium]|nr:hypothetical protein [Brevinematales bacterium]